ncbi:hypothetical protein J2S74_003861 [Evansella vedderi]|uniref:Uncharacterized protein n=1 Tax=Evansella vedderi TaxID=38282 RepID=A0ABT9ZYW0_9BACI|nr:hypothetical protein [Evansella vedderi]MDQ0256441.1 hypothetical protein [Evansella vedderi]
MINVSSIELIQEEKPYAYNVVFTVNNSEIKYATDIVYSSKYNYWLANPFITHELSSLLMGHHCPQCREVKIACLTLCGLHVEVTKGIIEHPSFQQYIVNELSFLTLERFPTELHIETSRKKWDQITYNNAAHKILRKVSV